MAKVVVGWGMEVQKIKCQLSLALFLLASALATFSCVRVVPSEANYCRVGRFLHVYTSFLVDVGSEHGCFLARVIGESEQIEELEIKNTITLL